MPCPPVVGRGETFMGTAALWISWASPRMSIRHLISLLIHNKEGHLHVGCTGLEPSAAVKNCPFLTKHRAQLPPVPPHRLNQQQGHRDLCYRTIQLLHPVPAPSPPQISGHMFLFCQLLKSALFHGLWRHLLEERLPLNRFLPRFHFINQIIS